MEFWPEKPANVILPMSFCGGYLMQKLSGSVVLYAFFQQLSCAQQKALLLDYDGTLAPFTIERNRAVPYPDVAALLKDILSLGKTRIVIVSGRAIADLIGLLGLDPLPEIWGSHGWEHLSKDGIYSLAQLDEDSKEALRQAAEVLAEFRQSNLCEIKPVSVAAHWRGLPPGQAKRIASKVTRAWSDISKGTKLSIHPFDEGVELRPQGKDKGSAVTQILSTMPDGVTAAYLGDDITDEDAFMAMTGRGIRVLVRDEFRPTAADVWLRPPGDLLAFLTEWKKATTFK
jgi:trehalose 6-phosphate phosphatase